MLKRVLAFLLIFSLFMTITTYPAVANSLTAFQKAEHLNKMSIISDYNSIFNLDKQITRAEAVVYAARLLGAEDYINANSQFLRKTSFSDVPEYKDYAPYVGFCTSQGIISGVGNGMFNPDGIATEKAFLVILFGVLGYKSGVDFTWNNLYSTAFSLGLVKDISYITKTTDNLNFTRADAVNIMFNALTCKIKGIDITLVERLVEINFIDIKDAVDAGLIDKSVIAARIDSITTLNSNRIMIKFDTDIKELTNNSIEIYETADINKKLSVNIISQSKETLILQTSTQKAETDYTIVIKGVVKSDGNTTEKVTGSFKGHMYKQVDSDFFRVSVAEAYSKNAINVYFTQPVNSNAEYPGYYNILKDGVTLVNGNMQNLTVKCLNSGNGVTIYLNDDILVPGIKYTLKIDGDLVSKYGTYLNDREDESLDFYIISDFSSDVPDSINNKLKVSKITVLDRDTIEVLFSKEVDSYFAKQFLNYKIFTSKNTTISVDRAMLIEEGEYKNRAVLLGLNSILDSTAKYDLCIYFLPDALRASTISNERFSFTVSYTQGAQLNILRADALSNRIVSAILDKPLVPTYAETPGYYTILTKSGSFLCNPIQVVYTPLENSKYKVLLLLPQNVSLTDNEYKLKISKSLPFYISSISKDEVIASFSGNKNNIYSPKINEALIVGNNAIKLTFDDEISASVPNLSVDNYRLEYSDGNYTIKRIPTAVIFIDSKTLVLLFDNLNFDKAYILKWEKIVGLFGMNYSEGSGTGGEITVMLGKR